jgi:parvulin-like peptidyl-prolyl isomerase
MQKAREVMEPIRSEEIQARFAALQDQHGGKEAFYKQFELKPEDEEKLKADIADGVQLEKYFEILCEKVARPSGDEVREYYAAHPDEFSEPERVHAAHIIQHPSAECPVEKVYADLLNIRERLLAGESFEDLAAEFSHCQDGGEDLGYFTRGQMVPSFEEVAFSTPVGEFSDVFKSEFGYHILKVYDYQPERTRAFDEVRYDIEALMMAERKNDAIGLMVDELRAAARIENLQVVD